MTSETLPTIAYTEHRLENGMRVILAPDDAVPIAALSIWYDVGSRDEQPGLTGLAHLFEHMMFQGSANVAKGEHFAIVQSAGGTLNATTWWHRTNYFESAPSHHLETLVWLEADRLASLPVAITQENLDNQRDVVKNERRQRYDDMPYGGWLEALQERLFPDGHPYQHATIGSMDDLTAASVEDCKAFFKTHYAPNNAVISVAGDFEPDIALKMIESHFGPIPANPKLPTKPEVRLEPGGLGVRAEFQDKLAPLPRLFFGHRGPGPDDDRFSAIEMASAALSSGGTRSTRIYKTLVRERELCQDASFFAFGTNGAALVGGHATPRPGVDLEAVEKAFLEVVDSVANDPPKGDELDRLRALKERQTIEAIFQTCDQRADALSEAATVHGDPREVNEILPKLLAVTSEQIGEAAAAFLNADNRVTLTYIPEGKA
ncbi:MAG: M16 family metallopeptidase [Actinomycetota bacterium]